MLCGEHMNYHVRPRRCAAALFGLLPAVRRPQRRSIYGRASCDARRLGGTS